MYRLGEIILSKIECLHCFFFFSSFAKQLSVYISLYRSSRFYVFSFYRETLSLFFFFFFFLDSEDIAFMEHKTQP